MGKRKQSKRGPTTLVRISDEVLEKVRAESKRTGIPLRVLGDRALLAYLGSKPGA